MELERRNIERRDFGQVRRGYDPAEVDRHLRAIADAVEELRGARAEPQPASLAGAAAQRVEAIVAAAEASARDIEEKARADAKARREQAERDAAERVKNADAAVTALVARAHELQREASELVGRVGDLKASVASARGEVEAVQSPVVPPHEREPLPDDPAPPPDAPEPPTAAANAEPEPEVVQDAVKQVRDGGADKGRASEGARLIALNMALSGTPREETARYLRENFDLENQDELLDEVYARAGG